MIIYQGNKQLQLQKEISHFSRHIQLSGRKSTLYYSKLSTLSRPFLFATITMVNTNTIGSYFHQEDRASIGDSPL